MSDIKTDAERIKAKILNYEFITESDVEDLITTIESQKEELATALKVEEIYREERDEARSDLDIVKTQIESLKAITELAVKGLKQIAINGARCGGMDTANFVLADIERIQNAQT